MKKKDIEVIIFIVHSTLSDYIPEETTDFDEIMDSIRKRLKSL